MESKRDDIIWDEFSDQYFKTLLITLYADDIQKTHKITNVVFSPVSGKWIVKLEKDFYKEFIK